jgi:hypothetical protein
MTRNSTERLGGAAPKAADRAGNVATATVNKAVDAADAKRGQAADALDTAAGTVDEQGRDLPKPLSEYAGDVKDGLETAADYVRSHDVREMAGQAAKTANELPVASLLILSAVVLGGGLLVASMVRNDDDSGGRAYFSAASTGLGPKASATVTRIRDAAFSMALTKAIDTIEDMFPGFREHFDKA